MKKLMLTLAALCLTGMFAATALAADASGLYLSGKLVYSYTQIDGIHARGPEGEKINFGDKNDSAFGGMFAVGYDFYKQKGLPMRAELEYAMFTEIEGKKSMGGGSFKQKFDIQTLFINAYYDFHNKSQFTPYIGAGFGLAFVDNEAIISAGPMSMSSESKMRTNFAWQIGFGSTYDFTENWSLDAGYRFAGLGSVKAKNISFEDESASFKTKNIYMHQFYLGARYTF